MTREISNSAEEQFKEISASALPFSGLEGVRPNTDLLSVAVLQASGLA